MHMDLDLDFARWEVQLRKGSLGLAVLASLWDGRLYGLEVLRRLEEIAGYAVPEGTIYPLLNRLKSAAYVESEWVDAQAGHPRKYYQLTAAGRRYVRGIAQTWSEFAAGMDKLLAPLEEKSRGKRRAF
jgi:PadR family transcriptional regulator, regulatory protein PadR